MYTQTPGGDDGHAVLSGNARVNQNGNRLTGLQLDVTPHGAARKQQVAAP